MNKVKSNQGYTLSIVLVIFVVLAILTTSILFSVSHKSNVITNQSMMSVKKITLENKMYDYINNVVVSQEAPVTLSEDDFNFVVNNDNENSNIYIISLNNTNYTNHELNIEIEFSDDYLSYNIIRWSIK